VSTNQRIAGFNNRNDLLAVVQRIFPYATAGRREPPTFNSKICMNISSAIFSRLESLWLLVVYVLETRIKEL
jgi:branched-subunit amino acid transport protein AzlD